MLALKVNHAAQSSDQYHLVINLALLVLVPSALFFALFTKVVRIQTRTSHSGVWHRLAIFLHAKAKPGKDQAGWISSTARKQRRKEVIAFEHYLNGIINDDEREELREYFKAGHTGLVFVSSPEELHTGELVMDWLVEVCKACPCRFKQGFDWAGAGNSYEEDKSKWAAMAPIMKEWTQAMRDMDTAEAEQIILRLKPMLIKTSWYFNYRGKVQGALAQACQASPKGECVAVCVEGGPVTRVEHLMMDEIVQNVRIRGKDGQNMRLSGYAIICITRGWVGWYLPPPPHTPHTRTHTHARTHTNTHTLVHVHQW